MLQHEGACPVNEAKNRLRKFYYDVDVKSGMCSKCHPCKLGAAKAIELIEAIQSGKGEERHVSLLMTIARNMKEGSMCKKGKDQADMLSEMLGKAGDNFSRHVLGVCDHRECPSLTDYEINAERCTMCDACRASCPSSAVEGQKKEPYKTGFMPYRIRQKRCTHCGACLAVCPEGAVVVTSAIEAHAAGRSDAATAE
jgi:formate hydrogenlyase subunit 6/NADH:ubiquinone oxidoreductase subunit I